MAITKSMYLTTVSDVARRNDERWIERMWRRSPATIAVAVAVARSPASGRPLRGTGFREAQKFSREKRNFMKLMAGEAAFVAAVVISGLTLSVR
ncbi:hypothetical protein ABGB18_46180 [Nonomuraea sp. B12E4]|uniref:hypothetical protein n=1 Tax=Nonomuraea sp. B12E4 TaxID=3153564 RepID=UPI00325D6C3A